MIMRSGLSDVLHMLPQPLSRKFLAQGMLPTLNPVLPWVTVFPFLAMAAMPSVVSSQQGCINTDGVEFFDV
jgi:hypothetical protein